MMRMDFEVLKAVGQKLDSSLKISAFEFL
jgi:hypothetical protein